MSKGNDIDQLQTRLLPRAENICRDSFLHWYFVLLYFVVFITATVIWHTSNSLTGISLLGLTRKPRQNKGESNRFTLNHLKSRWHRNLQTNPGPIEAGAVIAYQHWRLRFNFWFSSEATRRSNTHTYGSMATFKGRTLCRGG